MAEFDIGDRFQSRERRLDNPALADKMVRRGVSRREIDAVLAERLGSRQRVPYPQGERR